MAAQEKTRQELLTERIASASQRSLTIQVIFVVSSFASLCGSILPILKSIYVSDNVAYLITSVTTVAVTILLLLFFFISSWKIYLVRATVTLLFLLSLVLCGLLYWKSFVKVDEWVAWGDKVSAKVAECEKAYKEAESKKARPENYDDKVSCVGEAIREKYPHQGEEGHLKIASLESDIRAGAYLMRDPVVANVLATKLGIGEKFLGTGFAVTSDGKDYGDARLPEYLVPNLPESSDDILTWQISPILPNTSQTVECLIIGCAKDKTVIKPTRPSNIKSVDEKKYQDILDYVKNPENRFDEKKVILIRLNQFDSSSYKGTLGRTEASRVFMIRLRDVWNMSLKEAITYSGHQVDINNPNKTLFVWVYAPTEEVSIILATWKNIIPNIEGLLKKPERPS